MTASPWLYYAIISDTHLSADPDFFLVGENTRKRAELLVQALSKLSGQLSFVMHLGDVVHTTDLQGPRDPKAYEAAAEIFRALNSPLFCVPGNHDDAKLLGEAFPVMADAVQLRLDTRHSFVFSRGGESFVCIDGSAPLEREPAGLMTTQETALLEDALGAAAGITIFTHYPVLPSHVPWVDRLLLYENGQKLHQILRPFAAKIRAVFFGHFHNSYTQICDGITYVGVGGSPGQVGGLPDENEPHVAPSSPLSFLLVEQQGAHRIIRQVLV